MDIIQAKNILRSKEFLTNVSVKKILNNGTRSSERAALFAIDGWTVKNIVITELTTFENVYRSLRNVAAKMVELRGQAKITQWD